MAYATNRVILYDHNGDFACELSPNDVFGRVRVEEINGEHELTLITTRVLTEGTRVLTQDGTGKLREYVIYKPDRAHQKGENAIGTYTCMWSLQYDLMSVYADEHAEPGMGSQCTGMVALQAALDGQTRWSAGLSDVPAVAAGQGCVMIGVSAWDRLKLVVQRWHGEVDARIVVDGTSVTTRYVDLRAHLGSETAKRRFDWGEDLKDISRSPDPGPYYCRIIPLGRGQREYAEDDKTEFDWPIDISEETGGITYIQDDDSAALFRVKNPDGTYHYPAKVVHYDEDDPELLYNAGLADLHNHTRPKVQYSANVVQLARAGMDVGGVELGDNTQCIDRGFDPDTPLAIEGRILRMEVDELAPSTDTQLTIGDLGLSWSRTITDLVGESTRSVTQRVENIERGGTITYLETLVEQLNQAINATGGWTYVIPGEGIITYDVEVADPLIGTEASAVTQIKGGSIRIANSKKPNFAGINDWNWTNVIDAGHIAAPLVTTVQIIAGFIGNANGNFYVDLDSGIVKIGDDSQIGSTTVGALIGDVEDLQDDVDDARKYADNYLTFSPSNGVDVGYSGTLAKTRINGSGVTIYDGNGSDRLNASTSGIRVGKSNGFHSSISDTAFELLNGSNVSTFKADSSYVRIGKASGAYHAVASKYSFALVDDEGRTVFKVGEWDEPIGEEIALVVTGLVFGLGLLTDSEWQTVLGKYNVKDSSNTYALVIGGGTSTSNRKNIFTVGWDGGINTGAYTNLKSTNIDRDGANPSSLTHGNAQIIFRDASFEGVGAIWPLRATNGATYLRLEARAENTSGSQVYNYIDIRVDRSGNASYAMSNPTAFREAIGMPTTSMTGDDGFEPRWIGTDIIYDAIDVSSFYVHKVNGRMVQFYLSGTIGVAVSANGSTVLGTIASGYRPIRTVGVDAYSITRRATVSTSGVITLYSSAAISSGASVTITGVYISSS